MTADPAKIQRIIRKYCEQFYANKLDNLEEIDEFVETYNLSRLSLEETENLNGAINANEIKSVIKKLSTRFLDWMASQVNFTKESK